MYLVDPVTPESSGLTPEPEPGEPEKEPESEGLRLRRRLLGLDADGSFAESWRRDEDAAA